MMHHRHRAGGWHALALVLILAAMIRTEAARSEELLLVERPSRLVVLNRYQQTATTAEKGLLSPFVPMRVLKKADLLGDGFTSCTRVQVAGQEFFLLRDASGRLVGEAQAGTIGSFEGRFQSGDTVSVLRGGALRFLPAGDTREIPLAAGERLIRIFTQGGRTYCRRSGGTQPYGWLELPMGAQGRTWAAVRQVPAAPSEIPSRVAEVVRAAVTRTNTRFTDLFAFFNKGSERQRPVPRWDVSIEGSVLRCSLHGASPSRDVPESTQYLMKTIEEKLPGSGFRVFSAADGFEVRPE